MKRENNQRMSARLLIILGILIVAEKFHLHLFSYMVGVVFVLGFLWIGIRLLGALTKTTWKQKDFGEYNQSNEQKQSASYQSTTDTVKNPYTFEDEFITRSENCSYGNESEKKKEESMQEKSNEEDDAGYDIYACLVGKAIVVKDEKVQGLHITCVLGNLQLDLKDAIIKEDIVIHMTQVLGGVDLYLPPNVQIINSCRSILGDIRSNQKDTADMDTNIPTIFIEGNCILGGLGIKF